ncbi:hypothetical protein P167DRAFT_539244 [Morchella conica CCBAS932]|uniref:NAD(+) diphosphatase n=1 Tax=Morchella conica CCBAS932 TaxID=1392247 RepID=A0A3N4KD38_9PEZI|nr:hypothetical protein P167DRAFT_539244 [Morchella conica CCBAS932]
MEAPPYSSEGAEYPDSMLSRKFGREVVNYFSGSPLNRVSFLRSNTSFLRAALPASRFLLLRGLDPLASSKTNLGWVKYDSVSSLIGKPYDLDEEKTIEAFDSRVSAPTLIFLGLDEKATDSTFEYSGAGGNYKGQPFFALDVSPKEGELKEKLEKVAEEAVKEPGYEFRKVRIDLSLVPGDAAILAHARSLMDWNSRNQFCAACGGRTISVHAGTKRTCPPFDKAFQKSPNDASFERPPCVSRKGVHNIAFPRTDPTVIMAILNAAGTHLLLGRQRRWPPNFYSTLAGFCEPAESLEEAVRRETWEESGVRVGRVVIHSTQPWPYPNNLMIGAVGEALPDGEKIELNHDPELQDAQWFPIEKVKAALEAPQNGLHDAPPEGYKEGDLRLPPATAIAHQLMLAVANGFHLPSSEVAATAAKI